MRRETGFFFFIFPALLTLLVGCFVLSGAFIASILFLIPIFMLLAGGFAWAFRNPWPGGTVFPAIGISLIPSLIVEWGTLFDYRPNADHVRSTMPEYALLAFLGLELAFIVWLLMRAKGWAPFFFLTSVLSLLLSVLAVFNSAIRISGDAP